MLLVGKKSHGHTVFQTTHHRGLGATVSDLNQYKQRHNPIQKNYILFIYINIYTYIYKYEIYLKYNGAYNIPENILSLTVKVFLDHVEK